MNIIKVSVSTSESDVTDIFLNFSELRRDRNLSPTQGTVLSFHGSSSPVAGLSNASSSLLTISTGSGSGSETNSLLDIPGEREDILPSPRISPVPWQDEPNRHEFTVTALTEKLTGRACAHSKKTIEKNLYVLP